MRGGMHGGQACEWRQGERQEGQLYARRHARRAGWRVGGRASVGRVSFMRGGGHGGQAGKWRQGERREGRLLHAGWWAVHRRVNGVSRPPASDRRGVNEQCTLIGAAIFGHQSLEAVQCFLDSNLWTQRLA